MEALIELEQVSYEQRGVQILRGVSWRLERGEHWAILGANGSGKTTLLRLACGYIWPSRGIVRRLGQELVDLATLRRSIGWVAGDLPSKIPPGELAIDTVVSGKFAQLGLKRLNDSQPTDADYAAARKLLAEMRCDSLADKPFGVLSQGERQQTMVARARMAEPMLIVLDEPCAGMDPAVRERFLAWLDGLAQSLATCALVLVTHHVEEIMPSFERTLAIRDGRIAASGPTREIITPKLLSELYGIEVAALDEHAGRLWPHYSA